ncbi:unnamed protein product [Trichogramma brassicae]|uniref:Uncharacterized protein n=1 Tax=Trichogramma brassicae TaxID=86971 RepID=A0A6H5IZB0_9HYME|nr:unnamed protein product [Trichogramma brassicae]
MSETSEIVSRVEHRENHVESRRVARHLVYVELRLYLKKPQVRVRAPESRKSTISDGVHGWCASHRLEERVSDKLLEWVVLTWLGSVCSWNMLAVASATTLTVSSWRVLPWWVWIGRVLVLILPDRETAIFCAKSVFGHWCAVKCLILDTGSNSSSAITSEISGDQGGHHERPHRDHCTLRKNTSYKIHKFTLFVHRRVKMVESTSLVPIEDECDDFWRQYAVAPIEISTKKLATWSCGVSSGVELIHAGSQSRQGRGASKRARSCGEKKSYKRKRRTAECRYSVFVNLRASESTRIHVERRPCASGSCRRLCQRRVSDRMSLYSQPIAEAGLHFAHRQIYRGRVHLPAFHRATSNVNELLRLLHFVRPIRLKRAKRSRFLLRAAEPHAILRTCRVQESRCHSVLAIDRSAPVSPISDKTTLKSQNVPEPGTHPKRHPLRSSLFGARSSFSSGQIFEKEARLLRTHLLHLCFPSSRVIDKIFLRERPENKIFRLLREMEIGYYWTRELKKKNFSNHTAPLAKSKGKLCPVDRLCRGAHYTERHLRKVQFSLSSATSSVFGSVGGSS